MFPAMEMFELLPEMLKRLRKERGKTQKQVAKDSGCTNSQISRIENNKQTPTLDTLGKILTAFGLTRLEFVYRYEEVEREKLRERAEEKGEVLAEAPVDPVVQVPGLLNALPDHLERGFLEFKDYIVFVLPKPRP
jgi:transcriptional regulator with XRE-family HTH domain